MKKTLILVLVIIFNLNSFAESDKTGNGGSFIRSKFIATGKAILASHSYQLKREGIDTTRLSQMLTDKVIKIRLLPLRDNGKSNVDALGTPSRIILHKRSWKKIFANYHNDPVTSNLTILHELLRAAGYNDDDNRISGKIILKHDEDLYRLINQITMVRDFTQNCISQNDVSEPNITHMNYNTADEKELTNYAIQAMKDVFSVLAIEKTMGILEYIYIGDHDECAKSYQLVKDHFTFSKVVRAEKYGLGYADGIVMQNLKKDFRFEVQGVSVE